MRIGYHVSTLLLLFCFVSSVQAQTTITQNLITDRIGTGIDNTIFDLNLDPAMSTIAAATGAGQTWDFSSFVVSDTAVFSGSFIQLPADIVGADLFPGASFALEAEFEGLEDDLEMDSILIGSTFAFYSLDGGNFATHGLASEFDIDEDGTLDLVSTSFSPPSLVYPFPVEFGDSWNDSTTSTISFGFFETSSVERSESMVDGWGTLITPFGTVQALRITTTSYDTDPFTMMEVFSGTNIEFLSREGIIADIGLDQAGTVAFSSVSMLGEGMVGTPVEEGIDVPATFELEQNFPNPFNPTTTISYSLATPSSVMLTVYTLTGQEVRTLVNSIQPAGAYEVAFDASELASGLYLYRLETENAVQTRLMTLLK